MTVKSSKKVQHFTDLVVWQKAHKLFIDMYKKINDFPKNVGARIIADQIIRSCGSISANIAEGFNSRSRKNYIHYLGIALNSAAETENWSHKIRDCELLTRTEVKPWLDICYEIEKMLHALMTSLSKKGD